MRKILYVSGTRADYGLMRPVLLSIKKESDLSIELAVTGMHLMKELGLTINDIKKDNFKIHAIDAVYKDDNKESMAAFIGEFILKFIKKIKNIKPDMILVLGDRAEMLGAAVAGAYLMIPTAHIHGGDVTSTVDEFARHAITKLSHIHLPATGKSAERIIKMGEDPWRVHIVGAPGLDSILNEKLLSKTEIAEKYNLDFSEPVLLVIQHPVSTEIKDASKHMKETLEAVKKLCYQTIVIYPNADSGAREAIKTIGTYKKYPFIQMYKNIPHNEYLSLLKYSSVLIGNSSSGIIEAPSFKLPAVNIGIRQEGRERSSNVIDVSHNKDLIIKAVRKALYDAELKKTVNGCQNPYGDGKASGRIVKVLKKVKLDKRLLQKQINY
jgi:GDP/UDP-N,N'-diacetylbacillosamine 2-epimerase (hydrolysing)